MTSTATLNFDTLYLSDAGQYSCQVILTSSQLEGQHTVAAHYSIHFMSKCILLLNVLLCVKHVDPISHDRECKQTMLLYEHVILIVYML